MTIGYAAFYLTKTFPLTPALSPKGRGCFKSPLPFGERVRVRGGIQ
jgi:hypothetical protein